MLVPEWTKGGDPAPSGQRVDPESLSLPIDSSEGMLLITRIILDYIQQEQDQKHQEEVVHATK